VKATHTFHAETAADRDAAIARVAASHIATLDHALQYTSDFFDRNRIVKLRSLVLRAEACGDLCQLNDRKAEVAAFARAVERRLAATTPRISADGLTVAL